LLDYVHPIVLTLRYHLPALEALTLSVLDYVLVAGVLLGIVLAIRYACKPPRTPETFAALTYVLLMLLTIVAVPLYDPFRYSRVSSPLLLVGLQGLRRGRFAGWLPMLMVAARTGAQLVPQALGVLGGFLGR
jgi:hypothetical protein